MAHKEPGQFSTLSALYPMAFLPGGNKKADAMERGGLLYINNNSAG
jgi:hypothetical protein